MIINHNLNAMNAQRNMSINNTNSGKSMEKLSSGLRINRAGDDAAGLAISEKMRGQIRGLDQGARNAQDGISLVQTAEGALNETHSILQRMRELSVQASNDTTTADDRTAIQKEVTQLTDEIDRIANQTEFNTKTLLKGGFGNTNTLGANITASKGIMSVDTSNAKVGAYTVTTETGTGAGTVKITIGDGATTKVYDNVAIPATGKTAEFNAEEFGIKLNLTDAIANGTQGGAAADTITVAAGAQGGLFHVGANSNQTIGLKIGDMSATGLGVTAANVDVTTRTGAESAITTIDNAIKSVSTERANLGSVQNRLEHTIANLNTASENLSASESRVRDVDMAKEMMNFSKNNILSQAAQAMLAQANSQPQGVLQLLR